MTNDRVLVQLDSVEEVSDCIKYLLLHYDPPIEVAVRPRQMILEVSKEYYDILKKGGYVNE